ncbi:hypothetical protein BH23CHL8_BH23CHL8_25040 [soil metagenome]
MRDPHGLDRLGPPAIVRALGALVLGIVVALLAWVAFSNLYWTTRSGSLFDLWPLILLAELLVALTVGVFAYRHIGRDRRDWNRADLVALFALVAAVLALGGWVMFRPVP